MAGSGPAGSMNPKRRNARVGVVVLPADGYQGEVPPWPLLADVVVTAKRDMALRAVAESEEILEDPDMPAGERTKARRVLAKAKESATILDAQLNAQVAVEVELWAELWRTPQAEQWARLGWSREVAQYARHKAKGELGSLDDAKEARMLSDRLGLSPKAMRSLLWTISDAPSDGVAKTPATTAKGARGAKAKGATSRRHLAAVDSKGA